MSFILCVFVLMLPLFCGGGYIIIIWLLINARYGGKSTARMGYMQGRGDFFCMGDVDEWYLNGMDEVTDC